MIRQIDRLYLERMASLHLWPLYEAALKLQRENMPGQIQNKELNEARLLSEANTYVAHKYFYRETAYIATLAEFINQVKIGGEGVDFLAFHRTPDGLIRGRVKVTPRLLKVFHHLHGPRNEHTTAVHRDMGGCDAKPHREKH